MDAFKFNNKQYKHLFWDWLWTLYFPKSEGLYEWVLPLFKKYKDKVDYYLFSYSNSEESRMKLIEKTGIKPYFKEIVIGEVNKFEAFKKILDKYCISSSDVLIIGDNLTQEIAAAKKLGIDSVLIDDFIRNLP